MFTSLRAIAVVLTVLSAAPVSAEPDDTLLRLAEISYPAPTSDLALVNLSALRESAARSFANDPARVEFAAVASANLSPALAISIAETTPTMVERFGFSTTDMEAAAAWSDFRDQQGVFLLGEETQDITSALSASGFTEREEPGGPFLSLGNEGEPDLTLNPESIFGRSGFSLRIAPRGQTHYFARTDIGVERLLLGESPATDTPDIRVILEGAVAQEDLGRLVQAYFVGQFDVGRGEMVELLNRIQQREERAQLWLDAPLIPAFSKLAFLEWRGDQTAATALPFVFPTERSAIDATEVLSELLTLPLIRSDETIHDQFVGEVEFRIVAGPDAAILFVLFRRDLSEIRSEPNFTRTGYWQWYRLYLSFELGLLASSRLYP